MQNTLKLLLRRLILMILLSVSAVLLVSELSYRLLREESSRAPETIELVIPAGTAEKVRSGHPEPSIPEDMTFVVGDILSVKNEDSMDHQLGPLWIPAGKTASLPMGKANNFAYTCSFRPSQYLGIIVREPVTWSSRLGAVALAAPPTAIFLLVYSLVVRPLQPEVPTKPSVKLAGGG
jgi:hypothetical protein